MYILFIHDGFPGQFGHLAVEFKKRYNWKCDFIFQNFGNCPEATFEMLQELNLYQLPKTNNHIEKCHHVNELVKRLQPDLIVAHGVYGAPTLLIENIPIIIYCEYLSPLNQRNQIDNNVLQSFKLNQNFIGYSPTNWQRSLFPKEFQSKIKVIFDGINTNFWQPATEKIHCDKKIITYVARGFEPLRGFDIFMKVAKEIHNQYKDIFFYIVGENKAYYDENIEPYILDQNFDEFCFTGILTTDQLLNLLQHSNLHIYTSREFIPSWSLFNAMACKVPILALNASPIHEIIQNEYNGVIKPIDQLAYYTLDILHNPGAIGINARKTIIEKYSLDICIPQFEKFINSISLN